MDYENQTNYGHLLNISETCRRIKIFVKTGKRGRPLAIDKKYPKIAKIFKGIKEPHYEGVMVLNGKTCHVCAKVLENSKIEVWRGDADAYLCEMLFNNNIDAPLLCELWPVSERRRVTVYRKSKPFAPHYEGLAYIGGEKQYAIARMDEKTDIHLTFLSTEEYQEVLSGLTRKDLSDDPELDPLLRFKKEE